jgi:hypothetical protein
MEDVPSLLEDTKAVAKVKVDGSGTDLLLPEWFNS